MLFWVHAVVIVLLHALDELSTHLALPLGAVEINPLAAPYIHRRGFSVTFKAAGVMLLLGLFGWFWFHYRETATALLFFHHGVYSAVVATNGLVIWSLKRNPRKPCSCQAAAGLLAAPEEQGKAIGVQRIELSESDRERLTVHLPGLPGPRDV